MLNGSLQPFRELPRSAFPLIPFHCSNLHGPLIAKGGREIWIQASYNPILDLTASPTRW
ncbi:hypothetical protein ACVILL_003673 [Bradyrhizobium sp. USDA 3364]